MMHEIIKEISKSNKILLTCHPSPDPDSVCSVLALTLALEKMGKNVTAIQGDDSVPEAFKFPGIEKIVKKSYSEIDINEFDLFIITDVSDSKRISQKTLVEFPNNLRTIHIDHHVDSQEFAQINWLDTSYSSTSAMVYDLLKEMWVDITPDIASNLFIGIYTDTGGFRYGSLLPRTLKIASELASIAPNYSKILFEMENSNSKESLIFEGLALSSIKTFYDDKVAMACVSFDEIERNNIKADDILTGYISNKIKSVKGYDIAVTLIENEKNIIKISFRTRDQEKYDLSKIAIVLGGGGHKGAAGASLQMPFEEAIEKVAKNIKEIYNP